MVEKIKSFVKGYETEKITTFRKFKGLILDLLRGYPAYSYFGKFESIFPECGADLVCKLHNDGIIGIHQSKGKQTMYSLTPKGINLAISLINLEHSENLIRHSNHILRYSKQMKTFTITIIILGVLTLILGTLTFFLN